MERWKQAQKAEQEYHSDSQLTLSLDWTKEWISEQFSLNIEYLYGKRILEVGCGTGMIHSFDFPGLHIGIDPLIFDIDAEFRDSFSEILVGVGEQLPFKSGFFDVIICYNVIDHTSNPTKVLEECYRVLDDNGELLFNVNVFQTFSPLRRLADYIDPPHPHHFNKNRIKEIITAAGFNIIDERMADVEEASNMNVKLSIANILFGLRQYNARATKG